MIYVAVGGNLPRANGRSVREIFPEAAKMLRAEGVDVASGSGVYRSPAWPPSDQPDYLNAVWEVSTGLGPESLLETLHAVERSLGRDRTVGIANAARTVDLDLIDYRGLARGGRPVLPHPRMHFRAFVLLPLAEIAPGWRHPVSRRCLNALLEVLPADHGCHRPTGGGSGGGSGGG